MYASRDIVIFGDVGGSSKVKKKTLIFLKLSENDLLSMLSWLSAQTRSDVLYSTYMDTTNIENITNNCVMGYHDSRRCWWHPQTEKEKFNFSEIFRKWSPGTVELIRAHQRAQMYFLQHMLIPRTSKISLTLALWAIMIFVDFQIACRPKRCGHFPSNSTKFNYSAVLQLLRSFRHHFAWSVNMVKNHVKIHTFCTWTLNFERRVLMNKKNFRWKSWKFFIR